MRRSVLVSVTMLLALAPASAEARGHGGTVAPPGNSAVTQYLEDVPTASGARPSDTVHPGGGSANSTIGSGTARALAQSGAEGKAAAALAEATAPNTTTSPRSNRHSSTGGGGSSGGKGGSGGSAPLSSIAKALTGSSNSGGGGGMGPALPVILGVSILGAGGILLLRRHAG